MKPRQGKGFLLGPILFCIRMVRWVGLVLKHFPLTDVTSQWLYVSLVCRFHTHLGAGFLRVLRFPPTPKNQNPSIFLVHSFLFLVVCVYKACLAASGLTTYMYVKYHTTAPREPSGLISCALQKLLIIIIKMLW